MKNAILILFVLVCINNGYAQRDSILALDEVVVTDSKLRQFSSGMKVVTLTDSVLETNSGLLTDNLRFNTSIYFKENGYGMLSSPSFRGTTASQTAVVWNGININSQLTGQTDFNALMAQNLDAIVVRSGGGSTQYGSGAVGGSIHLNDLLIFNKPLENKLTLGYGSFNTRSVFAKSRWGDDKVAFKIGVGHFASINDYKYLGTDQRNENGGFLNNNLDFALGLQLSKFDFLKVYQNVFLGDRDFSGTLTAPSNDSYQDFNSRSLMEWAKHKKRNTHRVKTAYLFERFKYFPNNERDDFSSGKVGNFLLEYDFKYRYKKWTLNSIVTANVINAEGSSIQDASRNQLAATLLLSHQPNNKLDYGLNFRKDWVSDYESPFVFSAGGIYRFSKSYRLNLNASKNYRVPTFNDLYWQGSGATGNIDVLPETALQGEIGQSISGKWYHINLTTFYISTTDLIQWRPDISGVWSPINVKDVSQYGLELDVKVKNKINQHQFIWSSNYAYTKALDNDTQNQLLYVPLHKFTSNFTYDYKNLGGYLRGLYNGRVFTTTDNKNDLDAYLIIDLGLKYTLPKIHTVSSKIVLAVNNIANKVYQNVAFRPMPNRNIYINLNFKF